MIDVILHIDERCIEQFQRRQKFKKDFSDCLNIHTSQEEKLFLNLIDKIANGQKEISLISNE